MSSSPLLRPLKLLSLGIGGLACLCAAVSRLIIFTSGLFLMSSLGIGLFASTIANTQQEAMLTVMMYNLPSIFLSGFFFPLEAMPKFLQWVSYAIPLRYYLVVIRSLLLKGVGFEAIQREVIALAIFGTVIMGAAALRFRKRLD